MHQTHSQPTWQDRLSQWWAESPRLVFLVPSIAIILFLSIFPLVTSVYLSMSSIKFVKGKVEITFVGVRNYVKLLSGSEERHFLGKYGEVTTFGHIVLFAFIGLLLVMLVRYCLREKITPIGLLAASVMVMIFRYAVPEVVNTFVEADPKSPDLGELYIRTLLMVGAGLAVIFIIARYLKVTGILFRVLTILFATQLMWLMVRTMSEGGLNEGGLPGTVGVTLIFVFGGVFFQYLFGLGLALLVTQNLKGKRLFRVIFLMPMMITPVGIGFLFRMITNTILGPLSPIWKFAGLSEVSWADTPFGARAAVMIGDIWQWTPFMFIILLAALEGVAHDQVEAALVDGANSFQVFRFIIVPQIIPVSSTLILIRMIEAFKIIDMPQVLTYGGPGTATEPITLHALNLWRALDLGTSGAIAYMLLILVTFFALAYVNFIRRRLLEKV
jgi:ABC-type sugar transport system permease subunit